jgi:hypothetical protein
MAKGTKPRISISMDDFKNLSTEQLIVRLALMYLVANEVIGSGILGG